MPFWSYTSVYLKKLWSNANRLVWRLNWWRIAFMYTILIEKLISFFTAEVPVGKRFFDHSATSMQILLHFMVLGRHRQRGLSGPFISLNLSQLFHDFLRATNLLCQISSTEKRLGGRFPGNQFVVYRQEKRREKLWICRMQFSCSQRFQRPWKWAWFFSC